MKKRTTSQLACRAVSTPCREENEANLLVVQFPHPKDEYKFERSVVKSLAKPWTAVSGETHHRSFLQCEGTYRARNGKTGPEVLNFWGEWEGPADVKALKPALGGEPQWLLTPRYPKKTESGMNTDPFVFNGPFRYSFCRQKKVSLRNLAVGSMVLFGSSMDRQFVLDTVFVVGKNCGTLESYSKKKSLGLFGKMNIDAILKEARAGQCGGKMKRGEAPQATVYEGATPESPVNGIYSFAPAKLASGKDSVFARPVLDKKLFGEIITPALSQTTKNTSASPADIVKIWKTLTQTLHKQGFVLGVRFDIRP